MADLIIRVPALEGPRESEFLKATDEKRLVLQNKELITKSWEF